ncbi:MAG: TIGR00268 family protein [Rhodopirellula sp.]|nr:TIGR00268 family protein [Rhodopirellula sp.]
MNQSIEQNAESLIALLRSYRRVAVAFSGGVDSSVVAAACHKAGLDFTCAVTAQSPSVASWQLKTAVAVAAEIGIIHHVVQTGEVDNFDYQRNDSNRCFYCKDTLYASIGEVIGNLFDDQEHEVTVVSGTNYDDLGDHRPGITAGNRRQVVTPLAALEFGKAEVRDLARYFGLSNHDLPAAPCLASRIAYGVEVTRQRLSQIEQGEAWLRDHGVAECRVRLQHDGLARIEVPRDLLELVLRLEFQEQLVGHFKLLGFNFVTLDLEGFQSGKLNRAIVPLELPKPLREKGTPNNEQG